MKNFKVLILSTVALLSVVFYITVKEVKILNQYKADKEEIAEVLNFENRILDAKEYIDEIFTLFGDEDKKINEWGKLNDQATKKYFLALKLGLILFVTVFIYLVLNFFTYQSGPQKNQVLGISFIFASVSFLYLGLQTPFIEMEAYSKDLALTSGLFDNLGKTFEGRTYYLYQNKSVFELINLLFTGGNILVGLALVLFSVVFPITKLTASFLALLKPKSNLSKKSVSIINKLGKWSMADVFVSAVFLAVFSFTNMNEGVDTSAQTLIGLYFFLTFVILSIVSGLFLKQACSTNVDIIQ
ncbi:MAG: paraquat-inducible protein A [Putridiphycobacter sp.]